jgi:hypothetical protein
MRIAGPSVVGVVRVEWVGSVARIVIAGTVLPRRKMPDAITIRDPRRQVPGSRGRARRPAALQGKGRAITQSGLQTQDRAGTGMHRENWIYLTRSVRRSPATPV